MGCVYFLSFTVQILGIEISVDDLGRERRVVGRCPATTVDVQQVVHGKIEDKIEKLTLSDVMAAAFIGPSIKRMNRGFKLTVSLQKAQRKVS